MRALLEFKEKSKQIYADYASYIDKAWHFLLALLVFWAIGNSIGFFTQLTNPIVILALAIVCMFLPVNITVLFAALLVLANTYKLSLEIMAVTAGVMLIIYILYLRFTPKMGIVVLLMPLLFWIKIPYLIPLALGLVAAPASAIAACCGVVVYYMIHSVNAYAATISASSEDSALSRISYFAKNVFQNKEMYIMLIAVILVIVVVYSIRRLAINYSWEIAIAVGILLNFFTFLIGSIVFDVSVSYGSLIIGSVFSLLIAAILEFLFFTVDYQKAKQVQYEDDEYYVKAVPKIRVTPKQKEVKHFDHWKKGDSKADDKERRKRG